MLLYLTSTSLKGDWLAVYSFHWYEPIILMFLPWQVLVIIVAGGVIVNYSRAFS